MQILANTVVTLTFELFDSDGVLLESTTEPITYLHGGHSGMLPKLEEALNLKKPGDAISVDTAGGRITTEVVAGVARDHQVLLTELRQAEADGLEELFFSLTAAKPAPARETAA